jgi:chromosomal replication initiation ATPase DnaA
VSIAMPRQLPLDLVHDAAQSRDDLVVGPSNMAAVALIERWPDWPSPVVVMAGPPGSGKSHLGAVWQDISGATVLEPGKIGSAAIEAATHGPVLIDDIDSLPIDETGLFHLINAVRQAGTSLLLISRRFPLAWGVKLPDLESRLKAVSTVEIDEPDDMLLSAVVTKLFADRQVEVDLHVVQFLVRRMERSLSTAMIAVTMLDRVALERKTRVSRALAAEIVSAMDMGQTSFDL